MPSAESIRLDKIMERVRKMLARADHPNTPEPEADLCRARAEKYMREYKIEQEDLIAKGEAVGDQFNVLFKMFPMYRPGGEFDDVYRSIAAYVLHHCGVQGVWTGRSEDGERMLEFIGYEADIRYAEALYTNARLLFADRMEPKPDPHLSDADNVYRMRSAGMERIRVATLMGWVKGGAKVTRLYKQACEARGEDPVLTGQGTSVKDFRTAYAAGFLNEFWDRLSRARSAIDSEMKGSGLVLHGRTERIKEAMYRQYPHLRPSTTPAKVKTKVKPYRWTKADERRVQKMSSGAGRAGMAAGKKAASEVDVKGQTPKRRLGE